MRKIMLGAALAAATALPAPGSAQVYDNLCTAGAIRTCASIQVSTMLVGGNTVVTMRVRNLQGQLATDNTGGSLITQLGITAPDISGTTVEGPQVSWEGAGTNVGSAEDYWDFSSRRIGGTGVEFATEDGKANRGAIRGCDPSEANPSSYFLTCDSNQWVSFAFTLVDADFSDTNWQVAYGVQAVVNGGENWNSIQCVPGNPDHPCDSEVVPEPITMILLGSGLAGVGGVGLRRRRREQDEEDELEA